MQIKYLKTALPPSDRISRITSVAWSPNNRRLAVSDANRLIQLFDETGEKKDKFGTKPAEANGPKSYSVQGMAFSPDSTKLAIAQSDNIVFVYKLGVEWNDKKSICNKFLNSNPVCNVCWPMEHPNELVYTTADGKIKVGSLRNNKAATLFAAESYPLGLCNGLDGHSVLSSHMDGSIHKFIFDDPPIHAKFCHHPCPPTCVAWGRSVCVAGPDCRVVFYDPDSGAVEQTFDFSDSDPAMEEPTAIAVNPSGTAFAVCSMNRIRSFAYAQDRGQWVVMADKIVENMFTATAASWKCDGSRLAVANITGCVDLFDTYVRRYRYKSKFEFTYVSSSQIIVKRLSTGARIVLKSHFGYEIYKVNIYRDLYLVAHTPTTLLMGDLASCKLSEIPWNGSGNERFYFDNPAVCMIYNAGELTIIEYGRNEILGSVRTDYMSPHLISVQIATANGTAADAPTAASEENMAESPNGEPVDPYVVKRIAYLIDRSTVRILDLASGFSQATFAHDCKVDWLEMNPSGTKLMFRDKRRALHLFDVAKQTRTTLLHYCGYVQWVPNADVVVAQNRGDLCVWYDIDAPDRVTVVGIKGDVVDISRVDGTTEVTVDEGLSTVSYALDETLIEFGAAMRSGNHDLAADILSAQPFSPEIEAMWQKLAAASVQAGHLLVAERCYAALGDAAKSRYLRKVNNLAFEAASQFDIDGWSYFGVQAKMALLENDLDRAERIYLDHGQPQDAMEMMDSMHRFEQAIAIAERQPQLEREAQERKQKYLEWLSETGQEDRAAEMKEREGKYLQAISLYLKAGLATRAATLLIQRNLAPSNPDLVEKVAGELSRAGLFDRAGELFEALGAYERALECYTTGMNFRRAVELARREFAPRVVQLEQEWGDFLYVSCRQPDQAIGHYIEAGKHVKALEAALAARQISRAVSILQALAQHDDDDVLRRYAVQVASHFEATRNYKEAERFYVRGLRADLAVNMYTRANMLDQAYRVAEQHLDEEAASQLYVSQAQQLEREQRWKDAERVYLKMGEPDLAINMFKKARRWDDMLRLVASHRRELLVDTHIHLAQQLESEGQLLEAEHMYCAQAIAAREWKSAVHMYRRAGRWEDAYRVAKQHGGQQGAHQVAFAWAVALGPDQGGSLLLKLGLVSEAIDSAMETGSWDQAFELAHRHARDRVPEVHERRAMSLEDAGRFAEAESEFLAANKPREAVDMYVHLQDWTAALRIAEGNAPEAVADVLTAQARVCIERSDYPRAEQLLLRAKRPENAVKMYLDIGLTQDAQRVAREYAPHLLQSIPQPSQAPQQPPKTASLSRTGSQPGGLSAIHQQVANATKTGRQYEDRGEFSRAIDAYLSVAASGGRVAPEDADALDQLWENAVRLSMSSVPIRSHEVSMQVASRLVSIGRPESAAILYENVDMFEEAASAYEEAGRYEDANRLRSSSRSSPAAASQPAPVPRAAPAVINSNTSNLDTYARRGQWDECLKLASQQNDRILLSTYVLQYVEHLLRVEKDEAKAVHALVSHVCPPVIDNEDTLMHILEDVVKPSLFSGRKYSSLSKIDIAQDAKVLLHALDREASMSQSASDYVRKWVRITHLNFTAVKCEDSSLPGLVQLSARCRSSLLRYALDLPVDKVFFDAGVACKKAGLFNSAFVFLNRYLDLSEAIDEPDESPYLENSEFEGSDIPFDFEIPEKHSVDEHSREEARSWVLTVSLDPKVSQELPKESCHRCGKDIWIGNVKCSSCSTNFEECSVSGFPIVPGSLVSCSSCHIDATREAWNEWVSTFKTCPYCTSPQMPSY
eukprot:ANDGO_00724.mRNA.1 Intraflagellar transport protein 172